MARRRLIAGNWKMNGLARDGRALAETVARGVAALAERAPDVVLCPPATILAAVASVLAQGPVALGGQDCHDEASGAHTGDIAAPMLADVGCKYVIVGHSERRQGHNESDARVRAKAKTAHEAGLIAIVCIGETLAERDAGRAFDVVRGQLAGSLPLDAGASNTVVAYEPVWAIGTGRNATAAQVGEVHALIRGELTRRAGDAGNVRILYGGSVKASNAHELLAVDDVDGALVGGASLKADEFLAIVRAGLS
jgi:triosephosphate isomerase